VVVDGQTISPRIMHAILEEARFAVRALGRSPGFTTVATLTLALGIAVSATMFSVVDGVLLRPLPFRDPSRLVAIVPTINNAASLASLPEFFELRDKNGSFVEIAADKQIGGNLTGGNEPEHIEARGVTGAFFPMLGVKPYIGRTFTHSDETTGISPIGVISHGLWQRRFGGERTVLGKVVHIDDDPYTIVGVMPPGFEHPAADPARPVEFWFATSFRGEPWPDPNRFWRALNIVARLKPGVTLEQAAGEVQRFAGGWRTDYADAYPQRLGWDMSVRSLQDVIVGNVRRPLSILLGAVGMVMLIACANVAGLQLARQTTRVGEMAVRQALGAGRWRIARPLLIESVLLSVGAAVLGAALAVGGVALFRGIAPASLPRVGIVAVDLRVLGASLIAAIVTGVAFGLAPALNSTRADLALALRSGGRGVQGSGTRARAALVVGELALALALLSSAGLLVRTLAHLNAITPGFATDDLLTMELAVPYPNDAARGKYLDPAKRLPFYREVLRRTREVAGVTDAAMSGAIPLASEVTTGTLTPENASATTEGDAPRAEFIGVSEGYFKTMDIPVRRGRDFTLADNATSPRVAVVSETVARRLWPSRDPVGQRFKLGSTRSQAPWVTVIGVVGDVRSRALELESPGQVYASFAQSPTRPISLAIRTQGSAEAMAENIRRTVRSVESDQPVYAVRTMNQILASQLAQRRFAMACLVTFAMLAVSLAAVGLYGLIAYTVAQRRREIGVRMALGAPPRAVTGLVLRDGLRLGIAGVALGIVGVLTFSRVLSTLLYDVSPQDPVTLGATALGTLAIAAIACVVPGRRAARVSPLAALRDG
jgi:predicted permease